MTIDTNIKKSTNNINEVVEEQIKALSKSTKEMIRETNDSFISIMEKLDGNFENLDKQMQHEITKALQILVNKMTGFNSEFVKVHGDMIRTISSSTNDLIERRRQ
jgi:phosphate uptake regulator